jgi:hypothetical protein
MLGHASAAMTLDVCAGPLRGRSGRCGGQPRRGRPPVGCGHSRTSPADADCFRVSQEPRAAGSGAERFERPYEYLAGRSGSNRLVSKLVSRPRHDQHASLEVRPDSAKLDGAGVLGTDDSRPPRDHCYPLRTARSQHAELSSESGPPEPAINFDRERVTPGRDRSRRRIHG